MIPNNLSMFLAQWSKDEMVFINTTKITLSVFLNSLVLNNSEKGRHYNIIF